MKIKPNNQPLDKPKSTELQTTKDSLGNVDVGDPPKPKQSFLGKLLEMPKKLLSARNKKTKKDSIMHKNITVVDTQEVQQKSTVADTEQTIKRNQTALNKRKLAITIQEPTEHIRDTLNALRGF